MSPASERILDQILMLQQGNRGNTLGHLFLEDRALSPLQNSEDAKYFGRRGGTRFFIPPKNEDLVLMFRDRSGVYVHSDGFCTFMDKDISKEVEQWEETR